jgi:putative nucleotidyltransferase with HDIG domain
MWQRAGEHVTETIAIAAPASPRGLGRIWGWIRTSILRRPLAPPAPRPRSLQSKVTIAQQLPAPRAGETDDDAPVEPHGARLRAPAPPPPAAGVVLAPIRQGLSEVPPLPHVVRELLRELSDPLSNARSVARIAASDPTLAASLIRTVNSAALGLRRKITSVTEAVSYLGYSTVRSLVIRMRLQHIMPTRSGQAAYDAEDLWVHSLAVAYAAEALAERSPGVDRGFVSTLGLLHDIGKLAINSYFPDSAKAVRTPSAAHPEESFLDRERRILGADHAEIGAMLAVHWKLPADLVEAIRWHHAPQDAPAALPETTRTATILVHAANQLAKYCYVYSEDMEIDIVNDALLRQAGLPGPLTRLLSSRVRRAISRAIFFADDNSTTQSLNAIRRFVRLADKPALPMVPAEPPPRHEPHIAWANDEWDQQLGAQPFEIDCSPASLIRFDRAIKSAGRCAKLSSRCTAKGIERLLSTALAHQEQLPIGEDARLPAKFVLRRLLPNLSEIAPSEPVEVIQSYHARVLITAVRSPALSFAMRLGENVNYRAGRKLLDGELANVLNLRWFTRILTPKDGSAVIFVNQVE